MSITVPTIEKKAGQTILISKTDTESAGQTLKEKGRRIAVSIAGLGTLEDLRSALECRDYEEGVHPDFSSAFRASSCLCSICFCFISS